MTGGALWMAAALAMIGASYVAAIALGVVIGRRWAKRVTRAR